MPSLVCWYRSHNVIASYCPLRVRPRKQLRPAPSLKADDGRGEGMDGQEVLRVEAQSSAGEDLGLRSQ